MIILFIYRICVVSFEITLNKQNNLKIRQTTFLICKQRQTNKDALATGIYVQNQFLRDTRKLFEIISRELLCTMQLSCLGEYINYAAIVLIDKFICFTQMVCIEK